MAASLPIGSLSLFIGIVVSFFTATLGEPIPDPNAQKPKSFHGTRPDLSVLIKPLPNGFLKAVQDDIPSVMEFGSSFDLDCHIAPGGDPQAGIVWLRNGRQFIDSARSKVIGWLGGNQFQDYQIRFFNYTLEDAAVYTCVTPQGNINATLGVPPFVSGKAGNIQVFTGETLQIPCPVSAFPPMTYRWIDPSGNVLRQSTPELDVAHTTPIMNGSYECEGSNSIGQASVKTDVLVKERLAWTETSPGRIVARPRSTVQLQCHATGYPISNVMWTVKKQGKPVEPVLRNETDGVLTLFLVSAATSGNYSCTVHSTLPCCSDVEAQPPLVKTMELVVQDSTTFGADSPTSCPDGSQDCSSGVVNTFQLSSLLAATFCTLLFAV